MIFKCYSVGKELSISFEDEAYRFRFLSIRKIRGEVDIFLKNIGTVHNRTVMLTKAISGVKFQYCRS